LPSIRWGWSQIRSRTSFSNPDPTVKRPCHYGCSLESRTAVRDSRWIHTPNDQSFPSRVGTNTCPTPVRPKNNEFCDLYVAVARKNADAVARFRGRVVPHLHTIVRRALRSERSFSPLPRELRTEARELQAKKARHPTQPGESCVRHLALSLCNRLVQAIRRTPGRSTDETILRVLDSGTVLDESTHGRRISPQDYQENC
jgi:hypothetical protein